MHDIPWQDISTPIVGGIFKMLGTKYAGDNPNMFEILLIYLTVFVTDKLIFPKTEFFLGYGP